MVSLGPVDDWWYCGRMNDDGGTEPGERFSVHLDESRSERVSEWIGGSVWMSQ